MKLLLDTCAISELRRDDCLPAARAAIEAANDDDLFLSVITIGEIQNGISLLPASNRKQELEGWLSAIEALYANRILPITRETARIWGEITARSKQAGRPLGAADGLIAATAIEHGLHVFTRNSSDFISTGVLLSDPWSK